MTIHKAAAQFRGGRELLAVTGSWGDTMTDEETLAALVGMLATEIEVSRYPLSPRIVMLKRLRAGCAARRWARLYFVPG